MACLSKYPGAGRLNSSDWWDWYRHAWPFIISRLDLQTCHLWMKIKRCASPAWNNSSCSIPHLRFWKYSISMVQRWTKLNGSDEMQDTPTHSGSKVLTRLQRLQQIAALVKRLRQASRYLSICIRTSRALVVGLLSVFQNKMRRNMEVVLISFETRTVFTYSIFLILLHATFHRAWVKLPSRFAERFCKGEKKVNLKSSSAQTPASRISSIPTSTKHIDRRK